MDIFKEAESVYNKNFPKETWFERALFFSWYCGIRDCAFCYMSTQPKNIEPKKMKRSTESLLAEAVIAKVCGWKSIFLSGGTTVYDTQQMSKLLPLIVAAYGDKIWLNIGPLTKEQLELYKPYIHGVVGAIETVNLKLHDKICPSKPLLPYLKMFEECNRLEIANAMTFIVGVGEKKEDLPLFIEMIKKYDIKKIHVYSLIPEKGTIFYGKPIPTAEEQAWWIAQLRVNFPKLAIQCGIWKDRIDSLSLLLKAGANSFSKFPATRLFGTEYAKLIEREAQKAGRTYLGTLTKLPSVDWKKEVDSLLYDKILKDKVYAKLQQYLKRMKNREQ